jgi:hypothetical protein
VLRISVSNNLQQRLATFAPTVAAEEEIKAILAQNFREVWSTEGASINVSWDGNTLVQSGRLRDSMQSVSSMQVSAEAITVNPRVDYASYVQALYPFMELSESTKRLIFSVYIEQIRRLLQGPT